MHNWHQTWIITRRDLATQKLSFLWTLLFSLYFVLIFSGTLNDFMVPDYQGSALGIYSIDLILLIFSSVLGFGCSKENMKYWSNDLFSKKLAYFRTLPIRTEVLIWSRVIHIQIFTLYTSSLLFTTLYFLSDRLNQQVTGIQYIWFVFTLIGFSWIMSSIYMYFEQGYVGRNYLWICVFIGLVMISIVSIIHLAGGSIIMSTLHWIKESGPVLPVLMLLVGLLAWVISIKLTISRVQRREFR